MVKRINELINLQDMDNLSHFLNKSGLETTISGDNGVAIFFPKEGKNVEQAENYVSSRLNFLNQHGMYNVNLGVGKIKNHLNSTFYEMEVYASKKF